MASLGLIAYLVQQFLLKLTPQLDNVHNEVGTVGIFHRGHGCSFQLCF